MGDDIAVSGADGDIDAAARLVSERTCEDLAETTYMVSPLRQNAHSTLGNRRIWNVFYNSVTT
jgi:hypothetical protein